MRSSIAFGGLFVGLFLAACSAGADSTPPQTTVQTPNPSATPLVQRPDLSAEASVVPSPTGLPPTSTAELPPATATDIRRPDPVTVTAPVEVAEWAPPPYPAPWVVRAYDHFYFSRPIPSGEQTWLHPRYRYGNTHFGEEPTHTGVDIVSQRGTPVLAAGPGEVVWVGYGLYRGVRDETDPYGLAIAIEHDFGHEGQQLFTVYAHLSEVHVWDGQRVEGGDQIGTVGITGHASGAHLHFEVRLGENRYFATRNPELWTVPAQGWGVLAGRLLHWNNRPIEEQLIQLTNVETEQRFEAWTYVRDTVHPDDHYQENVVIGDLPAGPYEAQVNYWGRAYKTQFYVYPGQTNFIEFVGFEGFQIDPTPTSPPQVPSQ